MTNIESSDPSLAGGDTRGAYVRMAMLCGVVALLMAGAAAAGVFARGDGTTLIATTIRGEHVAYAVSGVYAYNAERVVAEGVGWDWFTLVVAAPALLAAAPRVARGSLRGRLFALGLLGYAFYQYLMYATTWAFGPLFPLFIVIYGLSLAGIAWIAPTIPLARLPELAGGRFPRRGMAIVAVVLALVLVAMWTVRIAAGLRGDWDAAMLLGTTTMTVQALDLGIVVPLSLWTGVAAWRNRPIGYLLSSVLAVKGVAMASAIVAMLLSAWAVEGHLDVAPTILFAAAAVAMGWLGARMFAGLAPRPSPVTS
jgi:hypothetical protein